jgi:hypothetical protein
VLAVAGGLEKTAAVGAGGASRMRKLGEVCAERFRGAGGQITGAGGDNGTGKYINPREISVGSCYD